MQRIQFITGALRGRILELVPGKSLRIGRDPSNDICLPENNISRNHALLVATPDGLRIENVGATNGIWINGRRKESEIIKAHDVVAIGASTFRVLEDASAETGEGSGGYRTLMDCILAMQRILAGDGERLVERSLETLFLALPATRLSLFHVEADGTPKQGFTATRSGVASGQMSKAFASKVLAADQAILLDAGTEDSDSNWGATLEAQKVRSILGVPVREQGRTVAVILCDNLDQPGQLSRHHIKILEFAAQALGHVFTRSELRRLEDRQASNDREQLAARRIQRQILTKDPRTISGPGRWSVHYQPALDLGGDFFDFHESAGVLTWVVADVSGKGVPAALVVSMLKAFCKTLHPQRLDPWRFLLELHGLFRDELPPAMFFTALAARVEPDRITWCDVGHPPGLVLHADGRSTQLPPTPGVLGMWPEGPLPKKAECIEVALEPGDRLCFYTDGLLEAQDREGRLFDLERIEAVLGAARQRDLAGSMTSLLNAMVAHTGREHQEDDVTLVLGEM